MQAVNSMIKSKELAERAEELDQELARFKT